MEVRLDDIIASCETLQGHVLKVQEDAQKTIKKWEDSVRETELAEKEKILKPVKAGKQAPQPDLLDALSIATFARPKNMPRVSFQGPQYCSSRNSAS